MSHFFFDGVHGYQNDYLVAGSLYDPSVVLLDYFWALQSYQNVDLRSFMNSNALSILSSDHFYLELVIVDL